MPERIIAIGDIHGCAISFATLLEAIQPSADDLIIPLGDYVDRGPDSKRVLDMLIELSSNTEVKPILGNHEQMMLAVIDGETAPHDWLRYGGVDTLDSYGFDGDLSVVPQGHTDFIRSCLDYVETDKHFFIHANYEHDQEFNELDDTLLRWTALTQEMPGPHKSGKIAVLGHTPDKTGEIFDVGYLKCIDTFCYGGMWLTALDVLSGKVWQTNEEGVLRD